MAEGGCDVGPVVRLQPGEFTVEPFDLASAPRANFLDCAGEAKENNVGRLVEPIELEEYGLLGCFQFNLRLKLANAAMELDANSLEGVGHGVGAVEQDDPHVSPRIFPRRV